MHDVGVSIYLSSFLFSQHASTHSAGSYSVFHRKKKKNPQDVSELKCSSLKKHFAVFW